MTVNKQERYFEGQEVLVDDLGFDQNARIDQDRTRIFDFWTGGVISDPNGLSNMAVSVDAFTNTLIDVSQGVAYINGNRINIDTDIGFDPNALFFTTNGICTPRSSGNRGVPLASYGLGTPNYVWAQYQQTVGTGRTAVSLADGTIHYPNEFDGYAVVVTTSNYPGNTIGLSNAVYLATVLGQGVGNPLLGAPNGLTDSQKQFAKIKTTLNTLAQIGNGQVRGSASNAGGQREILQGTVSTPDLRNLAVTSDKIDTSVAGNGLAGGGGSALSVSVDNATIEINADTLRVKDQGITTVKIADANVTTIKIADQNVTPEKIADGAITSIKIADQNVTTAKIADLNVTTGKIANSAVDSNKIAASVAGNGLSGGGGSPLAVNVDNSTIQISGDTLLVKDGGITTAKLAASIQPFQNHYIVNQVSGSAVSGTTTILNFSGPCILMAVAAHGNSSNNPGGSSATWRFRITIDGSLELTGTFVTSLAAAANVQAAAPDVSNLFTLATGSMGTKHQLHIMCQSSLLVQVEPTAFSDGSWTVRSSLVYAAP